jgi:hypothetical protein
MNFHCFFQAFCQMLQTKWTWGALHIIDFTFAFVLANNGASSLPSHCSVPLADGSTECDFFLYFY